MSTTSLKVSCAALDHVQSRSCRLGVSQMLPQSEWLAQASDTHFARISGAIVVRLGVRGMPLKTYQKNRMTRVWDITKNANRENDYKIVRPFTLLRSTALLQINNRYATSLPSLKSHRRPHFFLLVAHVFAGEPFQQLRERH